MQSERYSELQQGIEARFLRDLRNKRHAQKQASTKGKNQSPLITESLTQTTDMHEELQEENALLNSKTAGIHWTL